MRVRRVGRLVRPALRGTKSRRDSRKTATFPAAFAPHNAGRKAACTIRPARAVREDAAPAGRAPAG